MIDRMIECIFERKSGHLGQGSRLGRVGRGGRLAASVLAALTPLAGLGSQATAAADMSDRLTAPVSFDIPAQPLNAALKQLAKQAGIQILFEEQVVRGVRSPKVKSQETPLKALDDLLKGTPLEFAAQDQTVAVRRKPPATSTLESVRGTTPGELNFDGGGSAAAAGSDTEVRLAQVPQRAEADTSHSADFRTEQTLAEVIVTAQKREESLLEVPVPVTAVSGDVLTESHQLRIQDYYTKIPGLSLTSTGLFGSQNLTIRGITTGPGANPTVGVVVDDVPYGGTSTLTQGDNIPDIDPGDLARVEVLRGPQGALYGAASMGGLLKFVTVDPSTDALSGRVQVGTTRVAHGSGTGYNVRGSVNLPVNDTFALRASAFTREEPGYIDDPTTHSKDVNDERVRGARLATLWRPADGFSLKLSALYQEDKAGASSDVDVTSLAPAVGFSLPPLGDLQQSRLPGTGGFDKKLQAYSATLNAKLGSVDLTSITGYNIDDVASVFDYSYLYGPTNLAFFQVSGSPLPYHSKTKKISQEIRAAMPFGEHWDWAVGAFVTHEHNDNVQQFEAVDETTDRLVSAWATIEGISTYSEYALFTNLTYRFNDRFDIQIGGRESEVRGSFREVDTGPHLLDIFGETPPFFVPEADYKKGPFTYLFTPRWKVTPDWMVYARLASGFRAGGVNNGAAALGAPADFSPDKTQNYELGAKGDLLDHTLTVDASVYYIEWKGIQVAQSNGLTGFTGNANRAKSQGIELAVESRPLAGLTLSGWVAWSDAKLTEPFPSSSFAYGVAGDRLPTSPKISGSVSIEQQFPLTAEMTGFVGGSLSYTGDRLGIFQGRDFVTNAPLPRQSMPGYAKTDLRAGVRFDDWTVDVVANNVTDRRGMLGGGIGYFPPYAFQYIQPRTLGLSVARSFR